MTLRLALAFALAAAACHHATTVAPPANAPDEPLVEAPPADVPPPTVELRGGSIFLSEPIEFETGSDRIAASSEDVMAAIAAFLGERTDLTLLRIESHSDAQGADEANQQLTEQRAFAIARWLAANGVDCTRLIAVGFGETKPIADNRTAEGRSQNRRVELVPAALRGHLIGGAEPDGGGKVAGDPCQ